MSNCNTTYNEDYLHGLCHEWLMQNILPNDKVFMVSDYDEDLECEVLVHCGIYRDKHYIDVRGVFADEDSMLSVFDYGPDMEINIMDYSEFLKQLTGFGLIE